jgi:hypothetical protein
MTMNVIWVVVARFPPLSCVKLRPWLTLRQTPVPVLPIPVPPMPEPVFDAM